MTNYVGLKFSKSLWAVNTFTAINVSLLNLDS